MESIAMAARQLALEPYRSAGGDRSAQASQTEDFQAEPASARAREHSNAASSSAQEPRTLLEGSHTAAGNRAANADSHTAATTTNLLGDKRIIKFGLEEKFSRFVDIIRLRHGDYRADGYIARMPEILASYASNREKWEGRSSDDYKLHLENCKNAWLNKVPEEINCRNLAMHGTNLDVVLRALMMGGQLLPIGNLIKRGGQVLTGEGCMTSSRNLRRVSTVILDRGYGLPNALEIARRYATFASSGFLRGDGGKNCHVPIAVVGDGMDKKVRSDGGAGDDDYSFVPKEVLFKRLNIRGLLCRSADQSYVSEQLKKAGLNLPVNTFEYVDEFIRKHESIMGKQCLPFSQYDTAYARGPARTDLINKLVGASVDNMDIMIDIHGRQIEAPPARTLTASLRHQIMRPLFWLRDRM